VAYRQLFDSLIRTLRCTDAWIMTTMPRGALQIVQPSDLREDLLKSYARQFHAEDLLTWKSLLENRALSADASWGAGGFQASAYARRFLQPAHLRYMAVAPVHSPLLDGYHGALHVYRNEEAGDFNETDLRALCESAQHAEQISATSRAQRLAPECAAPPRWLHRVPERLLVLDASLQRKFPSTDLAWDSRINDQILADARARLKSASASEDRKSFVSSAGELWTFHVTVYPRYPALGNGAMAFYCLQPDCCDWHTLRATDLAADEEMARLVPAMRYMQEEFGASPTLGQIAKTVHLSPFHFHRRFTELFGITPKHFLLEWQICMAKKLLVGGNKELVDIARACGFAHQSHFTSRFKQASGLTPTRWRKLALKVLQASPGGHIAQPAPCSSDSQDSV
jgi:AraC-like DNA-binding protein